MKWNKWTIIMAVIVVASFIWEMIVSALGRRYSNDLAELLVKGEFDEFEKKIDTRWMKYCVPPFNLDYLKLNSYLLQGEDKKATEIYDGFRTKRLNNAQKTEVLIGGFNYFAQKGDSERTEYYRDEINKLSGQEELKKQVNRQFDVIFLKKTDLLDELLEETEQMEEKLRSSNEYLISQIYENKGDKKKAKEYEELAKKHLLELTGRGAKK